MLLITPEAAVIPMKDTWASLSLLKLTYAIARGSYCLVYSTWGMLQSVCVMHFCTDGSHKWVLFCFQCMYVLYHIIFWTRFCISTCWFTWVFLRDHSLFHSMDWDLFNQSSLKGCLSTCLQQKCNILTIRSQNCIEARKCHQMVTQIHRNKCRNLRWELEG